MKKKLKIIVCLVLITICTITIIQIKPTVDALGEDIPPVVEKPKRSCSSGMNEINAYDKYKPDINPSYHSNGQTYDIKVKAGTFTVYVYEIEYNEDTGDTWPVLRDKFNISGGSTKTYTLKSGEHPRNYDLVFNLIKSDQYCDVDEIPSEPKRKNNGTWTTGSESGLGYVFTHQVEVPASIIDPYFINLHYNGICSALRNGNYDAYSKQFSDAGLTKEVFEQYRSKALESFNYCNNYYVTVSYKESEVAKIIRNIIAGIKIEETDINGMLKGPDSTDSEIVPDGIPTDFSMQCPAYNGNQMPNQSATVKKYYKQEITNTDYDVYTTIPGNDAVCKKTCEENVTVTYGPPVASKAGLCFEYKVKVQSELNCVTEFDGAMPKPEDYTVCTPMGACNGRTYLSASGPSEDFDSCVASCDGGKYTQECIDACYDEVYTEENTIEVLPVNYYNKLMTTNNSKVVKLTSAEEERYNDILNAKDQIGSGKKYSIDDLKIAIVEASTGRYDVNSNHSIVWIPGTRYWEKPGRYYTLNITGYTVGRLKTASSNYWNTVWNQGGLSIVDNVGFLRNNAGGTGYCTAGCTWYGCSSAKNNEYYQGKDATNREFLNSEDAVKVYLDEFTRYEAAAKECKASAACTSEVSEFTIKVNNKTNSNPNTDNWIDYATAITESGTKTATTMNGKALKDFSIILDQSGCYSLEKPRGNATYMTEWSFPGTWINNKTGKISYEPLEGNAWHVKKEKFCTNLDSKYVNTDWWTQRILQPNTPVADSDKATIEEYNIEATAKNFGYFGWNFNISCFYALYDNPIPNDSSNNDDANEALAHTTRTVSLSDIFPNNENETITNDPNETGRTPGYNWTNEASNLKNLEYEVTPGALYSAIQARGNEIYNNQDMYLDYEFYLSPADLNTIRKYSKEAGGNYSNYQGKIRVANGIAYYESALFRNSITTSTNKLSPNSIITLGALGVNNQERKGSNIAETFENTYTAILKQNREEYLKSLSGGKE